jgi:type II secretion system protein G
MRTSLSLRSAFTLIELLIVVAIIAILAAIAVPNFLEAQVRSKVSRAKTDMRTVATALESYRVDNNKYPAPMEAFATGDTGWGAGNPSEPPFHSRTSSLLTTPIAYIASLPLDPFRTTREPPFAMSDWVKMFKDRHIYFNFDYFRGKYPAYFNPGARNNFSIAEQLGGAYLFYSVGPDGDETNGAGVNSGANYRDYDPSNGTISDGNIFRTQKNGELLGVDPYFYP